MKRRKPTKKLINDTHTYVYIDLKKKTLILFYRFTE